MNLNRTLSVVLSAAFLALVSCDPYVEPGNELPDPPSAEVAWYFLPDTLDGVIGIDSNTVVVEADPSEDVFMNLWDFGNGQTSTNPHDTIVYYVEGTYGISYQGHAEGGMVYFSDSVHIEKTLELPCEGTLALLTGCDDPKSWKFAQDQGAIALGPSPGSIEWYNSPEGGLVTFQYDDRWSFTEDGVFVYDNNGSTMNPFEGYSENVMTVQPSTYLLELGAGPNGEDLFTIGSLQTDAAEICGWMGVWDSGPTYVITEISETRLVLSTLQQDDMCVNPVGSGYFTFILEAE